MKLCIDLAPVNLLCRCAYCKNGKYDTHLIPPKLCSRGKSTDSYVPVVQDASFNALGVGDQHYATLKLGVVSGGGFRGTKGKRDIGRKNGWRERESFIHKPQAMKASLPGNVF